ncbi:glycosyl transferase family 1 [Pseudomonas fluorescens NCIMB 11764]|uniref:Glycosyl transferase family 1 n=1 Tax=Pseudomonas fluorescens NCIMB 11764 TaxID=1221522 RepID=A0A0K1QYM8_PSEFL|nr:glycosyltransferase family 4 protein [Pseudomonas fluorescens]AKV10851.1 glycosyl transferase family 1 [Pseudomonas fluorescens NCIMB 11764]
MKIAIVTQYFYPENFVINDIVRELGREGHTVEVFTGKPNYPVGKVFEGFTEKGYEQRLFDDQIIVHHAPLRPRKTGGAKNLLLNYASFVVNGLWHFSKLARRRRFDIIFVYAPSPITAVIPGIWMKFLFRAPLFLWVQDLWPESLRATGFITNTTILKFIGLFVRFSYFFVDKLLVQSEAFVVPVRKYANASKIVYYPNSYCSNERVANIAPLLPELVSVLKQYFCVVFAGNLGNAQSLDTIVDAAVLLSDQPDVRIVVVGTGSLANWLFEETERRGLTNIFLAGAYPKASMPQLFDLASALLVTLKKDEIFSYTVPSKIQAYLAAGRPIVAALDGEGARVVNAARAGLTGPAEDATQLAARINELRSMSAAERSALGQNGYTYYLENFELRRQTGTLVALFRNELGADKEI